MKQFKKARAYRQRKLNSEICLYASWLSMIVCMVCFAGTSWAWFAANRTVSVETIAAGTWEIQNIKVSETAAKSETQVQSIAGEPMFEAQSNIRYVVSVTMGGTVNNGFLKVSTPDGEYYTTERESIFDLVLSQAGPVTVSTSWGHVPEGVYVFNSENSKIGLGEAVVVPSEEHAPEQTEIPIEIPIEIPNEEPLEMPD